MPVKVVLLWLCDFLNKRIEHLYKKITYYFTTTTYSTKFCHQTIFLPVNLRYYVQLY